jgi:hypothetical protein
MVEDRCHACSLALLPTMGQRAAFSATTVPSHGNFHLGVGRKLLKFTTNGRAGDQSSPSTDGSCHRSDDGQTGNNRGRLISRQSRIHCTTAIRLTGFGTLPAHKPNCDELMSDLWIGKTNRVYRVRVQLWTRSAVPVSGLPITLVRTSYMPVSG